jgi:hypothetical protein
MISQSNVDACSLNQGTAIFLTEFESDIAIVTNEKRDPYAATFRH